MTEGNKTFFFVSLSFSVWLLSQLHDWPGAMLTSTFYLCILYVAVFGSLDMSRANSMTNSGQCRLAPLILCILDSCQLYDYLVRSLFNLHSSKSEIKVIYPCDSFHIFDKLYWSLSELLSCVWQRCRLTKGKCVNCCVPFTDILPPPPPLVMCHATVGAWLWCCVLVSMFEVSDSYMFAACEDMPAYVEVIIVVCLPFLLLYNESDLCL